MAFRLNIIKNALPVLTLLIQFILSFSTQGRKLIWNSFIKIYCHLFKIFFFYDNHYLYSGKRMFLLINRESNPYESEVFFFRKLVILEPNIPLIKFYAPKTYKKCYKPTIRYWRILKMILFCLKWLRQLDILFRCFQCLF